MNQIVNFNMVIDKELELELQGFRRTRRYIGDASQVVDNRWYRSKLSPFSEIANTRDEASLVSETQPGWEAYSSLLTRLFSLSGNCHQPASSEG